MCLTVRETDIKKNNSVKEFKRKVFCKVLKLDDKRLKAPFKYYFYKRSRWNYAETKPNCKITEMEWITTTTIAFASIGVSHGIHVFTNKKAAFLMKNKHRGRIVVKVLCNSEDLVSYGQDNQAVFNRVFLPPDAEIKR